MSRESRNAPGVGNGRSEGRGASDAVIALEGVEKSFGANHVLAGIDLEIRRGEILTLLGGSGTGKSVMLKHMIGLLRPDAGTVRVEGRDMSRARESDWVDVRKQIGFVFQGAALFDSLTVLENVAYGLREHLRVGEARVRERVAECLAAVGLEGIEERMPAELSGGMRKRVGVARAIALEPSTILYDEPTTGLDPANSRRIGQLIEALRERLDVTSVVVTHDLELCFAISDRVALLGAGQLLAVGTVGEIRASGVPEVREFLAGDLDAKKDPWRHHAGEAAGTDDAEPPAGSAGG